MKLTPGSASRSGTEMSAPTGCKASAPGVFCPPPISASDPGAERFAGGLILGGLGALVSAGPDGGGVTIGGLCGRGMDSWVHILSWSDLPTVKIHHGNNKTGWKLVWMFFVSL